MKRLLCFFTLFLLFSGCDNHKEKLRVYTWPDYISPEAIKLFEGTHNCKVIFDIFETNESMYAKLKAGASGYDIIVPSNYFVDILIDQKMLTKINIDKIPNLKYLDTDYLEPVKEVPFDYGIPYMVGITGIGYRKDRVPNLKPTWDVFSDTKLKGRMTMLNDIREVIGNALIYLGYSANSVDPNEIAEAVKQLLKWKPNLAKFESEQYKNGLASAEFLVVQAYTADVVQVILEDDNVGCLFAKQGQTMNMDCFAIPKGAKNIDLAHEFINFMLEPKHAALNMDTTSHLSPVTAAYPLVSKELREIPAFLPPREVLKKTELIRDVGPNIKLYLDAWRKVKDEW